MVVNQLRNKPHVLHMVEFQYMDFYKCYWNRLICLGNQHRPYIEVLAQLEFVYNEHARHQQIQVGIYKWPHDYRHGIVLLVRNYMDLDSVH